MIGYLILEYLRSATFLLCNQMFVGIVFSVQFQIGYNIYPQVSYIVADLKSAEINWRIQTKYRLDFKLATFLD